MNTTREIRIPCPEFRGGSLALMTCRDLEACLDGPAGTGKTVGGLFKIHASLLAYPGAKALVARKTNTALAGSAIATYREMIDPRLGVSYFGGNKVRPAAFLYRNGSELIVNGLDKPEKVKSWEFDLALINEATECSLEDIEFVRSRLRHGKTPYPQLIMDVNPGPPSHWLNVRMNDGKTTRLLSRHEDNPRFWDIHKQEWTEDGKRYIFGVLGGLTGVRLQRLRYGKWVAAEGMVYEKWDRAIHLVNKEKLIQWGVFNEDGTLNKWVVRRTIAAVDWGYTNPGCIQVYAIDGDGRMYMVREIYRSKRTIDWWLDQGERLQQEFNISQWHCDPSEPSYIAQFNARGLFATGAFNDIAPGISFLQQRLEVVGDGRPRFVVYEYALQDRDEDLAQAHKPVCFDQEVDTYVWQAPKDGKPVKEIPVDDNNHSLDTARYAVSSQDANAGQFGELDQELSSAITNYRGY